MWYSSFLSDRFSTYFHAGTNILAKGTNKYIHRTLNTQIIHFSFFASAPKPNELNEPPHIYTKNIALK